MTFQKLSIALLFSFSLSTFVLHAQVSERHGYIGIGMGPSFLSGYELGNEKPGMGLNLTLANFGYVFGNGFGVCSAWFGGAHPFDATIVVDIDGNQVSGRFEGTIGYGGLMIGPMYSFKMSDRSYLDIKARGGQFYVKEDLSSGMFNNESKKTSFGYSFSISYQLKFSRHWCIMLSGDYYSGEMESISSSDRLSALALNAGVGFAF